jgi:small subunit ribosomal protein S20
MYIKIHFGVLVLQTWNFFQTDSLHKQNSKLFSRMPQHKSCEKRMRTASEARLRNRRDRSIYRGAEKQVLDSTIKSEATAHLVQAYTVLDKMASKGLMHRNTAARHKAKLTAHVNALQS